MKTLPITRYPQIGGGADRHNNDCLAASVKMVLDAYNLATLTVNDIYDSMQPVGDVALSVGQGQTYLAKMGVKNEWVGDFTYEKVFGYLSEQRPIIALIHYAPLVDNGYTERVGFRGAHFLVLSGIDIENIAIQDPYRVNGDNIEVPLDIFWKAWTTCTADFNNPNLTGIVPYLGIQDLSVPVPVGNTYVMNATVKNGINVREKATSDSKLLYMLAKIDATHPVITVDQTSSDNLWLHMKTGDATKDGWVWKAYLTKVGA